MSDSVTQNSTDIENLAGSVKRGFDETATKQDILQLKEEIAEMHDEIALIERLPVSVERRLDLVEDDMRQVKTKVGIR